MSDEKRALADLHYLLVGTELSEYIFTLFLFFFMIQMFAHLIIHRIFHQHLQQSPHLTTL